MLIARPIIYCSFLIQLGPEDDEFFWKTMTFFAHKDSSFIGVQWGISTLLRERLGWPKDSYGA